jgi:hypothetical protein
MKRSDHDTLVENLEMNIAQLKRDLRKATHPRTIRTLQKSITDKGAFLHQIMHETVIRPGTAGRKVLDRRIQNNVK